MLPLAVEPIPSVQQRWKSPRGVGPSSLSWPSAPLDQPREGNLVHTAGNQEQMEGMQSNLLHQEEQMMQQLRLMEQQMEETQHGWRSQQLMAPQTLQPPLAPMGLLGAQTAQQQQILPMQEWTVQTPWGLAVLQGLPPGTMQTLPAQGVRQTLQQSMPQLLSQGSQAQGAAFTMPPGMFQALSQGLPQTLQQGVSQSQMEGFPSSLAQGLRQGLPEGSPQGGPQGFLGWPGVDAERQMAVLQQRLAAMQNAMPGQYIGMMPYQVQGVAR